MLINEQEYQRIIKEVEACNVSHSDFLRIMYIFGKFYVSNGKMFVDPKNLGDRIWGLIAACNVFGSNVSNSDLAFLSNQQKKLEERK